MKELEKKDIAEILKKRQRDTHKGTYGTVNAIVGSSTYRGAAVLATMGMLRAGVGIARICSVGEVCTAVIGAYPSATLCPLNSNAAGMISAESSRKLNEICRVPSVTLVGCGIGQSTDTANVVNSVISGCNGGLVIDADGLNLIALSGSAEQLLRSKPKGKCIITPHMGEMSRLCGKSVSRIKEDPVAVATEFTESNGCVTVLKDSQTVIAVPDTDSKGTRIYRSSFGNPGLARGGSGDVLAGLIAGFYAQGYTSEESAVLGVLTHGISADLCAAERSMQAMLPSDLDEYICRLFASLGY
ncbi:MAG: NAD(P)H-hydrate dehydratase [Clostridia bacterium]|nr:NAD(P)H-hydrate dehydratase [Clostridia bacterium]